MVFASILGVIGSAVGGLFGMKKQQGKAITEAIKVVSEANASAGQREQAIATIIASENASGYWLSSMWRPLAMMIFLGMLVSYWFGYVPPGLMAEKMPPAIAELFTIIKIGLGGYIGARTFEKIVSSMNVGSILKKYIEKKVL
jgi:hypothetical protein